MGVAQNAGLEAVQAELQLSPPPDVPTFHPDILIAVDAQRGGVIRPRIRHVRVAAQVLFVAGGSMTASLRVSPAPGFAWRLYRAHAYVRATAAGTSPREPTLRNLTFADLRITGTPSRAPGAGVPNVGSGGAVQVVQEAAASASATAADSAAIVAARITDDYDQLVAWTGAARGTWTGELLLDQFGDTAAGASVEFYYRRTMAAADDDKVVLCLSFLAATKGLIPA